MSKTYLLSTIDNVLIEHIRTYHHDSPEENVVDRLALATGTEPDDLVTAMSEVTLYASRLQYLEECCNQVKNDQFGISLRRLL